MSDTPANPSPSEIDTLKEKEQVRTLSKEKADANSLAKRNGRIAIIAAIATGLMTYLFIAENSAKGQATSRIGELQGQLEACNKKPSPAPILPATPAPATGNGSCVTQEMHVTVNGQPASSPSVKIEKKQKTGQPGKTIDKPVAPATQGHSCTFTDQHTGKVQNLMVASQNELRVSVTTGPACSEARAELKAKYLAAGSKLVSEDK